MMTGPLLALLLSVAATASSSAPSSGMLSLAVLSLVLVKVPAEGS